MRSHPAVPFVAFALALLAPAAVMAQLINGDDVILTDSTPEIAFLDTDGIVGFNWSIRGYDEYFRIVDTAAGIVYLNIDPAQSSLALGFAASSTGSVSTGVGYEADSDGHYSTALGFSANSIGDRSIAQGYDAESGGADSVALGLSANSSAPASMALGFGANADGHSSTALGYNTISTGNYSTAIGYTVTSVGNASTALGYAASSGGVYSIALGAEASAAANYGVALGTGANAGGHSSIALGLNAGATGFSSIALGPDALADQPYTLILGSIAGVNDATEYTRVGIGTHTPAEAVDVERSAAAARFQLTSFTATANEAPQFIQRRARGTTAAPTAVQNSDNLGLFSFRGYNGSSMGGSRATITAQAAGTFSASSTPTRLIFSTTPVGQTTPQSVLVITPDGKVQVKGVNLNVPDYVFEDDYVLMPPKELRDFINQNGHLPGIANAQQINEEGLDLAGSQMSQLQKIEELTLYMLGQESRLEAQQARIDHLETQLNLALARID